VLGFSLILFSRVADQHLWNTFNAWNPNLRSLLLARRGQHSEKPDRARDQIEQCSPGPYLELFGRKAVPGWTVWGNQCLPAQGRLFQERVG